MPARERGEQEKGEECEDYSDDAGNLSSARDSVK